MKTGDDEVEQCEMTIAQHPSCSINCAFPLGLLWRKNRISVCANTQTMAYFLEKPPE